MTTKSGAGRISVGLRSAREHPFAEPKATKGSPLAEPKATKTHPFAERKATFWEAISGRFPTTRLRYYENTHSHSVVANLRVYDHVCRCCDGPMVVAGAKCQRIAHRRPGVGSAALQLPGERVTTLHRLQSRQRCQQRSFEGDALEASSLGSQFHRPGESLQRRTHTFSSKA